MGDSTSSGSDTDSFRGLEKYVDRSGRAQKNKVWDAVLFEQDEQEQFGYYNEEKIAYLCQSLQEEHNAQHKVLERARKDRTDADRYLMTPRTMKLVTKGTATMGLATMITAPPMMEAENMAPAACNAQPPRSTTMPATTTRKPHANDAGPKPAHECAATTTNSGNSSSSSKSNDSSKSNSGQRRQLRRHLRRLSV